MGKLLLITAPSGAGKTTIVRHLLKTFDSLAFSISATTRPKRHYEEEGKDYYFLSKEKFETLIEEDAFVEWEEVYPNLFYGTLKREVQRLWAEDKNIIFDIEVKGATNIKKAYPDNSLAIFIKPPSLNCLIERLQSRKTENEETLKERVDRAKKELLYENNFDKVIINDHLKSALQEAENIVKDFLNE